MNWYECSCLQVERTFGGVRLKCVAKDLKLTTLSKCKACGILEQEKNIALKRFNKPINKEGIEVFTSAEAVKAETKRKLLDVPTFELKHNLRPLTYKEFTLEANSSKCCSYCKAKYREDGAEPFMCEGRWCRQAYDRYLAEWKELHGDG